jgi:hypothetical protein
MQFAVPAACGMGLPWSCWCNRTPCQRCCC